MYMVGNMKKMNDLRLEPLDGHDHIESLSKGENQLILCGVGGNGSLHIL